MGRYINFHSHRKDAEAQLTLVNSEPADFELQKGTFYSCGIHPWNVNSGMKDELSLLEELLQSYHEILAVGECGLDFHHNPDTQSLQEEVFLQQLRLAEKYNRPVILHVVKAENRVREIIRESGVKIPCVIHGFNKRDSVAQEWIKQGYYLSVGTGIINKNQAVTEAVKEIPVDRLFLETDDADLSVKSVYHAVSEILGCREDALIDQIELNFENLFPG